MSGLRTALPARFLIVAYSAGTGASSGGGMRRFVVAAARRHLADELFKRMAGIEMTHVLEYRTAIGAMRDLIAGRSA
jgi:hypothetical protein